MRQPCKTCVQCQNNVPLPPPEEVQNWIFRFAGMEENPGFQIKLDAGRDKHGTIELPCGCRFLTPDEGGQFSVMFIFLLQSFYDSSPMQLKRSLWRKENTPKAKHLFCDKDPDQEMRFMKLLAQRKFITDEMGVISDVEKVGRRRFRETYFSED